MHMELMNENVVIKKEPSSDKEGQDEEGEYTKNDEKTWDY